MSNKKLLQFYRSFFDAKKYKKERIGKDNNKQTDDFVIEMK